MLVQIAHDRDDDGAGFCCGVLRLSILEPLNATDVSLIDCRRPSEP